MKQYLHLLIFLPNLLFAQTEFLNNEELNYLKKFIYPISTTNPKVEDEKDLLFLNELIGNSNAVALGEVTHSSKEIFQLKHRIINYLIKNKEFDIVTMESPTVETNQINEFIFDNKTNAINVLNQLNFPIWENYDVLNMINSLHDYNLNHDKKVYIKGIDMQSYIPSISILETFYANNSIDSSTLIQFKNLLVELQKNQTRITNYTTNQKTQFEKYINQIIYEISNTKDSKKNKDWALHNITIITQYFDKMYRSNRDSFMADNFFWTQNQYPNSKFIIWAHNQHIMQKKPASGFYLDKKLKENYTSIGFTFFSGQNRVFLNTMKKIPITKVVEAQIENSTSIEAYLNSFNIPIFLLDLKKIKEENNNLAKWILNKKPYRWTGMVKAKNEFVNSSITDDFDYLIFINQSTISTLLHEIE